MVEISVDLRSWGNPNSADIGSSSVQWQLKLFAGRTSDDNAGAIVELQSGHCEAPHHTRNSQRCQWSRRRATTRRWPQKCVPMAATVKSRPAGLTVRSFAVPAAAQCEAVERRAAAGQAIVGYSKHRRLNAIAPEGPPGTNFRDEAIRRTDVAPCTESRRSMKSRKRKRRPRSSAPAGVAFSLSFMFMLRGGAPTARFSA